MNIEEYILQNMDQLTRAVEMGAKPEWIVYRSGMIFEMLNIIELNFDEKDKQKLKKFFLELSEKYTKELNQ